ncbi:MAG: DUF971 domain-containing protein [Akkermansiaceae bacterium]|jgi:DUF971 family protein|nr:DUF971 domain-containing protein [Akkermansiaceae bacterium]
MKLLQSLVVNGELALAFSDGEEFYLPLTLVRDACPCALCQGEPDAMGRVLRPSREVGSRGYELVAMETVGGYALQLKWGDGHSSGIYSFSLLRALSLTHT